VTRVALEGRVRRLLRYWDAREAHAPVSNLPAYRRDMDEVRRLEARIDALPLAPSTPEPMK
jgi:hypothetical protein